MSPAAPRGAVLRRRHPPRQHLSPLEQPPRGAAREPEAAAALPHPPLLLGSQNGADQAVRGLGRHGPEPDPAGVVPARGGHGQGLPASGARPRRCSGGRSGPPVALPRSAGAPHRPSGGVPEQPPGSVPPQPAEGGPGRGVGRGVLHAAAAPPEPGLLRSGEGEGAPLPVQLGGRGRALRGESRAGPGLLRRPVRPRAVRHRRGDHRHRHLAARLPEVRANRIPFRPASVRPRGE